MLSICQCPHNLYTYFSITPILSKRKKGEKFAGWWSRRADEGVSGGLSGGWTRNCQTFLFCVRERRGKVWWAGGRAARAEGWVYKGLGRALDSISSLAFRAVTPPAPALAIFSYPHSETFLSSPVCCDISKLVFRSKNNYVCCN